MKTTDWDRYYAKPYKAAAFTRKISGKKIVALIKKYVTKHFDELRIVELGGGNSCFYELIKDEIQPSHYTIVDNNELALRRFSERIEVDSSISLKHVNILDAGNRPRELFQVSFSVGLIEHFSIEKTAIAIAAHFSLIGRDGISIIAFPTPTRLYKISRGISEMLGMWEFWDERALCFDEVEKEVNKHGTVLHKSITWPIFFTQGVIVAAKR